MRYNTNGIILRKQNFRDGDSFFSIYTPDKGKVEAIARGVKKPKSKLGGHLDYFLIADMMIAEGKKYNHIGGAIIDQNFKGIKADLKKISLGFYCLEITDHFIKTEKKDKRIFYLLKDLLEALDDRDGRLSYADSLGISYFYILKLLVYLGYEPDFSACYGCRKKIKEMNDKYFDPVIGSLACKKCSDRNNGRVAVSGRVINKINLLKELSLGKLNIDKEYLSEIVKIIDSFLLYRLDGEIKSRRFLVKS